MMAPQADVYTLYDLTDSVIEQVSAGNWDQAATHIAAITNIWVTYKPKGARDSIRPSAIDSLEKSLEGLRSSAKARQSLTARQAANDLAGRVLDVIVLYPPDMPVGVNWLEILERQLLIDLAGNNYSAGEATFTRLQEIWGKIQVSLLARHRSDLVKKFSASLTEQEKHLKAKEQVGMVIKVKRAITIIHDMERVY
jgi:hypothetical protein